MLPPRWWRHWCPLFSRQPIEFRFHSFSLRMKLYDICHCDVEIYPVCTIVPTSNAYARLIRIQTHSPAHNAHNEMKTFRKKMSRDYERACGWMNLRNSFVNMKRKQYYGLNDQNWPYRVSTSAATAEHLFTIFEFIFVYDFRYATNGMTTDRTHWASENTLNKSLSKLTPWRSKREQTNERAVALITGITSCESIPYKWVRLESIKCVKRCFVLNVCDRISSACGCSTFSRVLFWRLLRFQPQVSYDATTDADNMIRNTETRTIADTSCLLLLQK